MTSRYVRQTVMPEIGSSGQARLAAASVLVVGAGGLGCPVLQYLAGAGVGRLIIVDGDRVEESNLHRQPLYRMADIGRRKAEAARDDLVAFNPEIVVEARAQPLDPANAADLVRLADIVVDAADSFAVTYTLSDICQAAGKPMISASAIGLSGYAGGFCGAAPSYRALFPDMPRQSGNCATAGVLGPAVGLIGALQAHLVLALILGLKPSPLGRLVTIDLSRLGFGGFSFAEAPEPAGTVIRFIAPSEVEPDDLVLDLRSLSEAPTSPFANALRITAEDVGDGCTDIANSRRIVLCCRSGRRAWRAANVLSSKGYANLALIALGAAGDA